MQQPTSFKKYSSIENHYQKDYMLKVHCTPEIETTTFCCVEKVHGSNFSFHATGDKVQCAKRSSMLNDDIEKEADRYFPVAVNLIKQKYTQCARNMFEIISRIHNKKEENGMERIVEKVIIFGELFGGIYKGQVPQHKETPIQKEIHYCPSFEFFAFDIFVQYSNNSPHFWIPTKEAIDLFEEAGFHIHIIPLFVGPLKECLDFDIEFETKIPSQFFSNLKPLGVEENICEGVIIKPWEKIMHDIKGNRIVIKKKNSKFFEKVIPNADKNKRVEQYMVSISKTEQALNNEKVKHFVQEMMCYLTDSRIQSVVSKFGSLDKNTHSKTLDRIAGTWIQDAVEECRKENLGIWEDNFLEKEERKLAMKHITQLGMKQFYNWFQQNFS